MCHELYMTYVCVVIYTYMFHVLYVSNELYV